MTPKRGSWSMPTTPCKTAASVRLGRYARSKRTRSRLAKLNDDGAPVKMVEPHDVLSWLADQNWVLETQVKRALAKYVDGHPVGSWLMSVHGIGPVISAGLLAHIDINKAPTAGHIWRFAGLDPTVVWLPKTKRPWNAGLKVLCWKAGESICKV